VRFELLGDYPREWKPDTRVRFHLGASEIIGRLLLLGPAATNGGLRAGDSSLAQARLEQPTVAARGDRFVIRSYSPSRTVGGGSVIEPVAERRRRSDVAGLDSLEVHESGTLESRVIEKLSGWTKTASTEQLATEVGESVTAVQAALEALVRHGSAVSPASGRWLSDSRWGDAREQVLHAVREYAERNPARYGIMKGELKAGLKATLDAGLFDLAFAALLSDAEIEQTGERARPGSMPWAPPAAALASLEKLEGMLEADGFQVPENAAWQKSLGAGAADASGLGFFLGRLVRVNAELTYTARQMSRLQSLVAGWFDGGHTSMTVADFRGITGASRKFSVPLLEHCDRVGWTVRVGDERRRG
jgi:selenocysteine-specific elongation factor